MSDKNYIKYDMTITSNIADAGKFMIVALNGTNCLPPNLPMTSE
jgi:hypothetical protein